MMIYKGWYKVYTLNGPRLVLFSGSKPVASLKEKRKKTNPFESLLKELEYFVTNSGNNSDSLAMPSKE